jgi:ankyrin repeat protein
MPCNRKHYITSSSSSVMQLVRNGANVHHVSGRPDGTTALHESVARGHERIADLLLHYGASPFLENGRGATSSTAQVILSVLLVMLSEGVILCR